MRLKFLHLHLHGLIRSNNLELGKDADTGGQTQYVLELVKSLANTSEVDQVDLVTRLIKDPKVDDKANPGNVSLASSTEPQPLIPQDNVPQPGRNSISNEPTDVVEDNPVSVTVSSERSPHSPSFQDLAPQP